MNRAPRAAILGYGNQGAAQAHCLRASGWQVVVGSRPGKSEERARRAGFDVMSLEKATASSEVVACLLPDEVFPSLFKTSLRSRMSPGQTAVFAHGFALVHGGLKWPAGVNVVLVSPTAPGSVLAREFDAGRGVPAYLAVLVDASGGAQQVAESYARALGCDRGGLLQTTVEEEVVVDLFGEQAVLVGGLLELVSAAVDTLVAAGYSPEAAYLECAHQVKFLADLLHREGPEGFLQGISATALYGGLSRGPRVVGPASRGALKEMLAEIESGRFARELLGDHDSGGEKLAGLLRQAREGRIHRLEEARSAALGKRPPADPTPTDAAPPGSPVPDR